MICNLINRVQNSTYNEKFQRMCDQNARAVVIADASITVSGEKLNTAS